MAGVNTTNITERLGTWNWNTSTKVALSVIEKKPPEVILSNLSSPIALIHVCKFLSLHLKQTKYLLFREG